MEIIDWILQHTAGIMGLFIVALSLLYLKVYQEKESLISDSNKIIHSLEERNNRLFQELTACRFNRRLDENSKAAGKTTADSQIQLSREEVSFILSKVHPDKLQGNTTEFSNALADKLIKFRKTLER